MQRGAVKTTSVILSLVFILLIVIFITAIAPGGEEGLSLISDLFYLLFSSMAMITGFIAVRRYGTSSLLGKTLLLLCICVALDWLGGVMWTIYVEVLGVVNPFPSLADIPWVLYYVAGLIAIMYPLRSAWSKIGKGEAVTLVASTLILSGVIYNTTIGPILSDASQTAFEKVLSVIYPIGGVLLMIGAIALFLLLRDTSLKQSFLAFAVGFASYAVADLLFTYQEASGTYFAGSYTDIGYYLAQLMFAYGFYLQIKAFDAARGKRV